MALDINTVISSETPGAIKLELMGQLDSAGAEDLERAVNQVLEETVEAIIFDLKDMTFLASAGLRIFAKTQRAMTQKGARTLFVNAQPQVRKVFDIVKAVKLSDIFQSYEELDAYLEAMQKG